VCCRSAACGAVSRKGIALAIGHATHYSRSNDAVNRVYDAAGYMIETHEHFGDTRKT